MDTAYLVKALALQGEWGAGEALAEAPVDRFAPPPAAPPAPQTPIASMSAPATAAARAASLAAAAPDLAALREAINNFEGFTLRDTATHLVFAEGDAASGLAIVSGPPTADDDRTGHPLSGADGALLDAMLASIGLSRDKLMLLPLLPWRPPGDRPPSPSEVETCKPFLRRALSLIKPRLVLLLGPLPAQTLLGRAPRQGWATLTLEGSAAEALVLPAPPLIARTPQKKRDAWAALRLLKRRIDAGTQKI
jgi:DNA polymerase